MNWIICFFISVSIMIVGLVVAAALIIKRYKSGRVLQPLPALAVGVALSAFFLFIPIYYSMFAGDTASHLKTFLLSVHNTFRLFAIDEDYSIIMDNIHKNSTFIAPAYAAYASILYVFAPLLTFGLILSFFKNLWAYIRYYLCLAKKIYVFSEINERSIILAEDIAKNDSDVFFIFTDVFEDDSEKSYELLERAKELRAIRFKKDILLINLKRHRKAEVSVFIIGEDEAENTNQSLEMIERYGQCENMRLYVFSTHEAAKMMLSAKSGLKMRVRRIDEIQSLIARQLYENGSTIFEDAIASAETNEKEIHAGIIGLGRFGTEMLRSLAWFCQMDGYRVTIDAFDSDPLAKEKFEALCPELLKPELNTADGDGGESKCRINIHADVTVGTSIFNKMLDEMPDFTYVLVCLGTDEANIKAAIDLRKTFERKIRKRTPIIDAKNRKVLPRIQSIVQSTRLKNSIEGITNFKSESYNIEFIGDLESCYKENVIIDSELENDALARHLKYGKEEAFWRFEYNYLSSVASAIHMKARIACGIPGADKAEDELTPEETIAIAKLEHRRWNAYIRSRGYIYSGTRQRESRSDLAKVHPDLVDFKLLNDDDINKDIRVGSK